MTRALVISGGGSKGAFAVGAIKHMVQDRGLSFDIYSGTSTGALVAPMTALGEIALLEQEYTTVTTADILTDAPLNTLYEKGFYFSTVPLFGRIQAQITAARYAALQALPAQIYVATVSLEAGRPIYFQLAGAAGFPPPPLMGGRVVQVRDQVMAQRVMLASCSEPVIMPVVPVRVNSAAANPELLVDGGVLEYSPLQIALSNGADEIYLVSHALDRSLQPPKTAAQLTGLIALLGRTIGLLTTEVFDDDLRLAKVAAQASQYVDNCRTRAAQSGLSQAQVDAIFAPANGTPLDDAFGHAKRITLYVIDPDVPFEQEGHHFEPALMKAWLARGKARAKAVLDAGPTCVFPIVA